MSMNLRKVTEVVGWIESHLQVVPQNALVVVVLAHQRMLCTLHMREVGQLSAEELHDSLSDAMRSIARQSPEQPTKALVVSYGDDHDTAMKVARSAADPLAALALTVSLMTVSDGQIRDESGAPLGTVSEARDSNAGTYARMMHGRPDENLASVTEGWQGQDGTLTPGEATTEVDALVALLRGEEPTDDQARTILAQVASIPIRDSILAAMTPETLGGNTDGLVAIDSDRIKAAVDAGSARDHIIALQRLAGRTKNGQRAPVLCFAAALLWFHDQSSIHARAAAEEALVDEPDHTLARLLAQIIALGIRPNGKP
ncbi:DUF4192 family protein [Calidifontibacter terrae]